MSREIRFRAWNKLAHKMATIDALDFMLDAYRAHAGKSSGSGHLADIELMQFTGLTDRQEKEIYESDVVRWDYKGMDYIRIVTWDADQAMFLPNDMKNDVEVIGNIYDNPELLQKADNP